MIISVTPRSMLCRLLEMAASCVPINNICPMLEATFVHPEICTIVETMLGTTRLHLGLKYQAAD
jgi:hypothetical protein